MPGEPDFRFLAAKIVNDEVFWMGWHQNVLFLELHRGYRWWHFWLARVRGLWWGVKRACGLLPQEGADAWDE